MALFSRLESLIGNTPVVDCSDLLPFRDRCLLVKLERYNIAGSVKDRVALHVIERAERAGLLPPGGTIIESSSGNLGIALAFIGARRGYRVIVIVDPKASVQNLDIIRAYGGEVVVEDRRDSTGNYHETRIERARQLERSIPGSYWVNQTCNPWNPEAHARTTAIELVRDCGRLDAVAVAVSSGGQIAGLIAGLRERSTALVAAVDVQGSAIFSSPGHPYLTPGIGLSWRPAVTRDVQPDRVFLLSDLDCCSAARFLARRGLLVGPSSGAVFLACCRLARELGRGSRVAGILSDGGERYLNTVFSDSWLAERGLRPWHTVEELSSVIDGLPHGEYAAAL